MSDQLERLRAAVADQYAIEREIGAGGMATVYLAEDLKHRRKVAIKVLREDLAQALGAERFLREIEIAAQLQHPHILPLHDSGDADGVLYYVMPYIDGESLRVRLDREHELPVGDATRILREVVDGLAKAHRQGVVHRDIKPDNVMLSDGHAVITDFGVAKAVSEATGSQQITTAGVALGTPAYMAPEQAVADPNVDHRADIYAVGVMAYEMLAGRPPFQGPNAQSVLSQHVTESPDTVTKHRTAVPQRLESAIMRCLEKKAADRWQTADELLGEIDALATPSGGTTPMPAAPVHVPSSNKKRVGMIVAAVAAFAAAFFAVNPFGSEAVALDPELVVVVPFAVTGPDDVQWTGEGIVNLMESNLAGSEGVHAVAAQTAIAAWNRAGGFGARGDGIVDIARDLGAGLLIQGNMVGSGSNLTVNATLTVLSNGEESRATESGSVDSIATIASRLLAQLFALQAGVDAEVAAALVDVPPDALRDYLQGQFSYRGAQWDSAYAQLGRAVASDSTFALAALGHWMTAGWMLTEASSPGLRLAWKYAENLPERDRLFLEAIRPDYPKPVSLADRFAATDRAVRVIGDRADLWYYIGDRTFHYGQFMGLTPQQVEQQAWGAFERALAIDPAFGGILTHKFDRALMNEDSALFDALVDSFPDVAAQHVEAVLANALARGDTGAIEAWFDRAGDYSFDQVSLGGLFASVFGKSPETALRAQYLSLAKATTEQDRTTAFQEIRNRLWEGGQPQAAAAVTERMYRELRNPDRADLASIQAALFMDGDSVQAVSAAAEVERVLANASGDPTSDDVRRMCWLGHWKLANGDVAGAGRLERRMAALDDEDFSVSRTLYAHVCSTELRALSTDGQERSNLIAHLDSIAGTGPAISARDRNRLGAVVARLYGMTGDQEQAKRAAMRSDMFDSVGQLALFRVAAEYAIASGDTTLAAHYLDWYLRARGNAEPELRTRDDELRAALARLVGEKNR